MIITFKEAVKFLLNGAVVCCAETGDSWQLYEPGTVRPLLRDKLGAWWFLKNQEKEAKEYTGEREITWYLEE